MMPSVVGDQRPLAQEPLVTSQRRRIVQALRGRPLACLAGAWMLVAVFAVVVGSRPLEDELQRPDLARRLLAPLSTDRAGAFHLLGTDTVGRDFLGQLMSGARTSILVGVIAAIVGGTFGVVLGSAAGYKGGRFDAVVSRTIDVQLAFPTLLLALLVLATVGRGSYIVVGVLSLSAWPRFGRVSRGLALELRQTAYVESAKTIGASSFRIVTRHVIPNLLTQVIVLATLMVATLMLASAGLDFLGVGVKPPGTSWGYLVSEGRSNIRKAWWLVSLPGIAIFLTALSINILAMSARAAFDPTGAIGLKVSRRVQRRSTKGDAIQIKPAQVMTSAPVKGDDSP